jgi:O-antigen ligase
MKNRFLTFLEIIQPVCAAPMFFSVVAGAPPLWAAWIIAGAPWLAYSLLTDRLIRRTPFDIPIAIFFLGLIVGFVVSPDKRVSTEALSTTFACILIYYGLVNNALRSRTYWRIMAGIGCLLVFGLTGWFFSQGSARVTFFNNWIFKAAADLPKTSGPILQFNNLGVFLAITVPVFFALGLFQKGRLRWLGFGAALFLLAAVFLTASGSGWGAIACGAIFVLAVWRRKTLWVTVPAAVATGIIIAVNYHRFSWPSLVFSTESLMSRVDLWRNAFPLLTKSWFTGLGLGDWPVTFDHWPNAHNAYIELYADTGLLGGLAMGAAAVVFVRMSLKIIKSRARGAWYCLGTGLIGGFLGGAAASVFEVADYGTFWNPELHYISIPLLWIMAALFVVSYSRLLKANS